MNGMSVDNTQSTQTLNFVLHNRITMLYFQEAFMYLSMKKNMDTVLRYNNDRHLEILWTTLSSDLLVKTTFCN